MANVAKITKEALIEGAISLIKTKKDLSARNIAAALGCSTQPLYSIFSDMQELEKAVCERIVFIATQKIRKFAEEGKYPVYLSYGLGFVAFARDESLLFDYLYLQKVSRLREYFGSDDPFQAARVLSDSYGMSLESAMRFHSDMAIYSYGLAVLQVLGQSGTDDEIADRLRTEFRALIQTYQEV